MDLSSILDPEGIKGRNRENDLLGYLRGIFSPDEGEQYRGTVLPYAKGADGGNSWAMPEILREAGLNGVNLLSAVDNAAKGNFDAQNPDNVGMVARGLLDVAAGGMAAGAPKGSLRALQYRTSKHQGGHSAPTRGFDNASLDDLTKMYPDDIYSPNGMRYYGTGRPEDKEVFDLINKVRNNPDADVTIYRAVPRGVTKDIYANDWVTPSKSYALEHAKYFDEGADILEETVKARDLFTEGNSIQEWGWSPDLGQNTTASGMDPTTAGLAHMAGTNEEQPRRKSSILNLLQDLGIM